MQWPTLKKTPEKKPVKHFVTLDADGWPTGFYRDDLSRNIPAEAVEFPEATILQLRAGGKRWASGQVRAVTAAQVRARQDADFNGLDYAEKRRRRYPSVQDQLDMQFHDSISGTTTWFDTIAAVKAQFPKP